MAISIQVHEGEQAGGVVSHNIQKDLQVQVHLFGVIDPDRLSGICAFETRVVDNGISTKITWTTCEESVMTFRGEEGDIVEYDDFRNAAEDLLRKKVSTLTS